jgi:hypothetical protein
MMMLVVVFTRMRMAVLIAVFLMMRGMLVGVPMLTMLVRMAMLVFVSAHARSSYPLASGKSPLGGLLCI